MNKLAEARNFFQRVQVITTVENTYRPELNGTRRQITLRGTHFIEGTLLHDTSDGRHRAGTHCRSHMATRASEVLAVSDTEATFRLGPVGTPLHEHHVTYRKFITPTGEIVGRTLSLPDERDVWRVWDAAIQRLGELRETRIADPRRTRPTLDAVRLEVKRALESPGNDFDPEALARVAEYLGIDWSEPET